LPHDFRQQTIPLLDLNRIPVSPHDDGAKGSTISADLLPSSSGDRAWLVPGSSHPPVRPKGTSTEPGAGHACQVCCSSQFFPTMTFQSPKRAAAIGQFPALLLKYLPIHVHVHLSDQKPLRAVLVLADELGTTTYWLCTAWITSVRGEVRFSPSSACTSTRQVRRCTKGDKRPNW
jgi:hypothetical protein